jgi:GGDEF domain-containing protein
MSPAENTLWSLMAGGLWVTSLIALGDTLTTRSVAAVRTTIFISAITIICFLLTGLPESLFPEIPTRLLAMLNTTLGPLSCSFGLRYLSVWIGGAREDPWTDGLSRFGSAVIFLAACALVVLASVAPAQDFAELQYAAAFCELITVAVVFTVSIRATRLGDPLARWLTMACPLLVVTIVVLNLREINAPMSLPVQAFGALSTVAFLLAVSQLAIIRNRRNRQLKRSTRVDVEIDPVTGLPTGPKLIAAVEHAFWRAQRLHGQCLAICVHVSNLYELGDPQGHTTNNQILAAASARIRRASGFRCVVGVYHPRCFIILFSQEKRLRAEVGALERIRHFMNQPLEVRNSRNQRLLFRPVVGISSLTLDPAQTSAIDALNELEHRAMAEALLRKAHETGTTPSAAGALDTPSSKGSALRAELPTSSLMPHV